MRTELGRIQYEDHPGRRPRSASRVAGRHFHVRVRALGQRWLQPGRAGRRFVRAPGRRPDRDFDGQWTAATSPEISEVVPPKLPR